MEQHSSATKKEVLSAVSVYLYHCHLGFLAVPRGSERVNIAGLEKRKEGALVQHFIFSDVLFRSHKIVLYIKTANIRGK